MQATNGTVLLFPDINGCSIKRQDRLRNDEP